jgi:antitoxin HicB
VSERYVFPAILRPDDGGYAVVFPAVPEALTEGATRAEALANARDALETALSFYIDSREALPVPGKASRSQVLVAVSPLGQIKLALYEAMREQGIGKAELGRRLGKHLPHIDRLLDLTHHSRMDALAGALAAVGKRLVVAVEDA